MQLAPLPVAIPLGMAAVLAGLNRWFPRRFADSLSIAAAAASTFTSFLLLSASKQQPIVYWFGGWTPRAGLALGISFVVEPLGAAISALAGLLMTAALIFSWRYFESVGTLYHVLMLVFLTGMCGLGLTGDFFNLFVFFELMNTAGFALCGYKIEDAGSLQGALNFAVTNTIGAFAVLVGLSMLYARTGALNLAQMGRALSENPPDSLVIAALVMLSCGFLIKAAVVPFHFWLADAHAVAPTPVCVLFSGVMTELGLFAAARVFWTVMAGPFAAHRPALTGLWLTVGVLTAVLGAAMCFGQRHIKRLLAFSTVSHMGLMLIGFALLDGTSLSGSALYVLGHGLAKASLFLVAGILLHRLGSVDELELHARARSLRGTSLVFFAGGLGLAGLAPFPSFLGEAAIHESASRAGQGWLWIVFLFAAVLTAGAVFRVGARVFLGWGRGEERRIGVPKKIPETPETKGARHRVPAEMFAPAAFLVLLAFAMGLLPQVLSVAQAGAACFVNTAGYQASVLDQAVISPALESAAPAFTKLAIARSVVATLLALALGGFALSPWWPARRPMFRLLRHSLRPVRKLHSGHVGDYAAFITFGMAGVGLVLALLIKGFGQ